ncbi:MAG: motility associated factor glycosyltransferase family protein, partial [Spirochaetota bacterium]
ATEAERFISPLQGEFSLYVVAGFGYAYHIEALLAKMSADATILVLEKDAAIVRSACENRDLAKIFSDDRFLLLIGAGEDEIAEAMRGRSSRTTAFIAHRGSCQADADYYPNIIRIARSYISAKDVNVATLAKFEKTWSSNIIRNLPVLCDSADAGAFFGAFAGIPAIVVAAGPSLTESIPFIRENLSRAVIVAVDTAYFILRRYGIEPHFCVSVDPQVINARYFEGYDGGSAVLIGDPCAHPSTYRLFSGRTALTGIPFDMMKWIERATGAKGEIAHGGSVSTNAYDFAARLGCSPVVLTGQDLAFTKGLAHARGSYLDEMIHLRAHRTSNAQMFNRFQLSALPSIFVRGIRSAKVHTNQKMMIFLGWFEKRNDPDLINATADGAYLNGIVHRRAEDISFPERGDIEERICAAYDAALPSQDERAARRRRIAEMVRDMNVSSKELISKLERAAVLSQDLCRAFENGSPDSGRVSYILKKLEDIDRSLESLGGAKDMIGLTVQKVIHTITEGYDVDGAAAVSKEHAVALKSRFLYEGLLEGARFAERSLDRISGIL